MGAKVGPLHCIEEPKGQLEQKAIQESDEDDKSTTKARQATNKETKKDNKLQDTYSIGAGQLSSLSSVEQALGRSLQAKAKYDAASEGNMLESENRGLQIHLLNDWSDPR